MSPRNSRTQWALGVVSALTALAVAACSQGGSGAATNTPASGLASSIPPPSAVPATTAVTPTAAPSPPITAITMAIAGPDQQIGLVTVDGKRLPLAQAPGTLFALATLSTTAGAASKAYAVGPQGVSELTFVNHSSDGFASFLGASAAQSLVAWDHWATNLATATVDSEIVVSNGDGSHLRSVLKLSSDHVLHAVRFAYDGKHLLYSYEPLGLGGYSPFGGVSDLYALDLTSGLTSTLVPAAVAGTICLDDLAADVSLVTLHCSDKFIEVLDPGTGYIGQIAPPVEVADWHVHGDARISPDLTRVAYALARGNPDSEQGWVAVSNGLTGTSRLIATAPAGDYFSVKGWLGNTTLVLQSWGAKPGVWVVQADGSDLRRLADGVFLGGG